MENRVSFFLYSYKLYTYICDVSIIMIMIDYDYDYCYYHFIGKEGTKRVGNFFKIVQIESARAVT